MEQSRVESPSVIVRSPTYDQKAHPSFIVPTRMGYRWRHFNHRISVWRFGLVQNGGGHPWADHLRTHTRGGPFSDGLGSSECPRVKFGCQRIDADSVANLGAARRAFQVVLGPSGVFRGRQRLSRSELNLTGYRSVTPLITGFGFDTSIPQSHLFPSNYHADHGYLTRGIGADVHVTDLTDEYVEIEFWIRYGFGASMDRPYHNEALLDARVAAELDVALIGATDVPVRTGSVDYGLSFDSPKIGIEQEIQAASPDQQRIRLDGEQAAPSGLYGVQGFNFELSPERYCEWNQHWAFAQDFWNRDGGHPKYGKPGYYIRELTLDLQQNRYDSRTGESEFSFNGYASNATLSVPFHPLRYHFTGRMAWIQADGTNQPFELNSEFQTGATEFALR